MGTTVGTLSGGRARLIIPALITHLHTLYEVLAHELGPWAIPCQPMITTECVFGLTGICVAYTAFSHGQVLKFHL